MMALCDVALFSRVQERAHLLQMFQHLLHSMIPLLIPQKQQPFTAELDTLAQQVQTGTSVHTTLESIQTLLQPVMDGPFQDSLQHCFTGMSAVLVEEAPRRESLVTLGNAWVHLGLVYLMLLTPSVPVDPVEKVAIKINHLEEEVIFFLLALQNEYDLHLKKMMRSR